MKRSRPSLCYDLAGVMLGLTALLLIPPVFASGLPYGVQPVQLPANFQNLPGPQAVVSVPTELLDPNPDHVRMRFYDPPLETETVFIDGTEYRSVRLSGEAATTDPGMPDVPRITRLVMVGKTGHIEPIILNASYTVQDNVLPPPMQPLAGDSSSGNGAYQMSHDVYQTNAWYPDQIAVISTPATFRDVRFVVLEVHPVQVNPVTRQMRVYDDIEVLIQNVGGIGHNEILVQPVSISPSYKQMYRMFENFEGSPLDALPVFPGSYLVICNNNAAPIAQAQKLVNWRKRKGIDASYLAMTITTSSATAIRDSIAARYNASGGQLEFVCLIGDPGETDPYDLPTHSTQYDNFYGCLPSGGGPNPDPVPDISVGRLPVQNETELVAVVDKTISYESAPTFSPDQDWFVRAWCAAHTSGVASNPATKEYTRQIMLQHGVETVYWNVYSSSIPNTDINAKLTTGISVFNHRMSYVGQTASNFSDGFPTTMKQPFVMSITCGTGDFESGTPDISERWLIPTTQTPTQPKGAIGCVGIATLNTHVPYNNVVDAGAMYGIYVLDVHEQGNVLVAGKLQLYKNYAVSRPTETNQFSYWTNLMGDPGVQLWTRRPEPVNVARPATINRGTNNVALTVTRTAGGAPVAGALVCLLKGSETFSRGYTAADGTINLPCLTPTTGYLHVTITRNDARPYLDSIQVVNATASLAHYSISIDDDNVGGTVGDNNDVLNPGETIDLTIGLTNSGTSSTVSAINATLTTSSPGIAITQAVSAYPNIAVGGNASNTTPFRFNVTSVFNNEPVTFFLNLTSSAGPFVVRVDLTPVAGDVQYVFSTFAGPGGNIDPGETGNLTVTFRDSGLRSLPGAVGRLRSFDAYITVLDSTGAYGTVLAGATITNNADPFSIAISDGAYNGHRANMQLVVTDANGFRDSTDFVLTIGTQTSTSPTGPDAYGYYAYDNTETSPLGGASTYEWIEIAPSLGGAGTSLNFNDIAEDGDQVAVLTLPFTFTMYGQSSNQITVCTNGWLSLGATTIDDFRNYRMGTPIGPPLQVAAYWDDLKAWGTSNNVYYRYDAANHWYIVEWRAQTLWTGVNEFFQIILYDPAHYPSATGDGKIKVQYQQVTLSPNAGSNDNDYASVGIQNADHSIGLDYYYWNSYSPGSASIASGRSIMFTTDANGQLNPNIQVSTPNGGENWFIGQQYNILWSSTAISGPVSISLNRNYPVGPWETLFASAVNDGVQLWTATGAATTNNARIRVISVNTPSIGDTSNASFTLQMPALSLITPNGGESWTINTEVIMQWTSVGVGAATVSLNRNYPVGPWEVIDSNAGTEVPWIVSGPGTSSARVRIVGNAVPTIGDTSNANFSIGLPPMIHHDPHPDQVPGAAQFVARVTDDLPGSTTKLFYKLAAAGSYDSLTMTPTGNPNELQVTTPALSVGRYHYFLRSTDTQNLSSYDPAVGVHKIDVGYFGPNWMQCDDGTAEVYNWVNGPGFKWAVKFTPASYPYALSGARFAICPTCPDTSHDAVVVKVYLADGAGGLPGTLVFADTTGPAGNVPGGLPAGAAWTQVITRINNSSITLNGPFYISVENSSPRIYPVAFGLDTNSPSCHQSYFWDECEQTWFNEDANHDNARPGNRMIRANGFVVIPPTVVIRRSANDVIVQWQSTGAPYYRVYYDLLADGTYSTLLGSTTANSFTDVGAVGQLRKFYRVIASDIP